MDFQLGANERYVSLPHQRPRHVQVFRRLSSSLAPLGIFGCFASWLGAARGREDTTRHGHLSCLRKPQGKSHIQEKGRAE